MRRYIIFQRNLDIIFELEVEVEVCGSQVKVIVQVVQFVEVGGFVCIKYDICFIFVFQVLVLLSEVIVYFYKWFFEGGI